ncbi:uncharacterized protein LOC142352111 [Convolutriloba macropyga]|uniref:uncharacterized protein LOC142352111 n=1 Tax=Convolutriloba macropyga TaxID=536237 RepID=UPI003F52205A
MEFESEEDYWSQAFDTFDQNGDGRIDKQELENLMQICKLNPTQQKIEEIMNEYSPNVLVSMFEHGLINLYQEIMQYGKEALKEEELAMFKEDFELCDRDKSGTINIKEFAEFILRMENMFFAVEFQTVEDGCQN